MTLRIIGLPVTLSKIIYSIMALSIIGLPVTFSINYTQHIWLTFDTQHNLNVA